MPLVSIFCGSRAVSAIFDALQTVTGTLTFEAGVQVTFGASAFPTPGKYAVYKYSSLVGDTNISTATFIPPAGRTVALVEIIAPYIYVTLV